MFIQIFPGSIAIGAKMCCFSQFINHFLTNTNKILYNINYSNYKKKEINIIIKVLKLQYESSIFDFSVFERLFYYIRRLKFNQGPNYDYIVSLFNKRFRYSILPEHPLNALANFDFLLLIFHSHCIASDLLIKPSIIHIGDQFFTF